VGINHQRSHCIIPTNRENFELQTKMVNFEGLMMYIEGGHGEESYVI